MAELMDLDDDHQGPPIFSQYEYDDMASVFNPQNGSENNDFQIEGEAPPPESAPLPKTEVETPLPD